MLEAKINRIVENEKLKAYASILLNGNFLVTGIRIVDGEKGRFVAMPCRRTKYGTFDDICFPLTKELRKEIEKAVLDAYAKVTGGNFDVKN